MLSLQLCNIKRSYSCTAFLLRITWSHPEVMKSFKHCFFFLWSIKKDNLTQKIYASMFSRQKEVWVHVQRTDLVCHSMCVPASPSERYHLSSPCSSHVRGTSEVKITPKSKTFFENIPWWSFEMFQLIQLIIWQGSSENHFKVSW